MRDLIFRPAAAFLARRLTGLRDDRERGAIAVLVAILLGAGVLFGMGALVIDIGQLYQNRAELQNGADAAALAVAKSCAASASASACQASAITYATAYATANASALTGGKAQVDFVCGAAGVAGGTLVGGSACPVTVTGQKNVCPVNPPGTRNFVDVETSTLLPSGKTVLPPVFAGTLAGGGGKSGTVYACAQAQWDGPQTAVPGNTIGITLGYCTWAGATGVGTSYPTQPPAQPIEIDFHAATGQETETNCPSGPAGQTGPGNFGWTANPHGTCLLQSSDFTLVGGVYTYGVTTGNSVPTNCDTELLDAYNGQLMYFPVYSGVGVNGQGKKATYNLETLAAFVVTGYNFGNKTQEPDKITGQIPCTGGGNGKGNGGKSTTCITGYFVHQLDETPGSLGNADLGLDIIRLVG